MVCKLIEKFPCRCLLSPAACWPPPPPPNLSFLASVVVCNTPERSLEACPRQQEWLDARELQSRAGAGAGAGALSSQSHEPPVHTCAHLQCYCLDTSSPHILVHASFMSHFYYLFSHTGTAIPVVCVRPPAVLCAHLHVLMCVHTSYCHPHTLASSLPTPVCAHTLVCHTVVSPFIQNCTNPYTAEICTPGLCFKSPKFS